MSEEIKGEAWLDERYRWHFKAGNYRVSEDPSCGVTGIEYAFFGPQGEMSDEDVVRKLATLDAENATLNKRIAELEYYAANNAMSIHAIMSTLDIDDETHGVADDMYETAYNLAHKLRTRIEKAVSDYEGLQYSVREMAALLDKQRTRAEKAEDMVEQLIEAIESGCYIQLSPDLEIEKIQKWYAKMEALAAEWQEREG